MMFKSLSSFWRLAAAGILLALAVVGAQAQPNLPGANTPPPQGQCPPGYTAKSNWGWKCYADQAQACPAGTSFTPNKGCMAAIVCPAGYAAVDGTCRAAAASACPAGYTAAAAPGGGVTCTGIVLAKCGPGETPNTGGSAAAAGTFCMQPPACPAGFVLEGRSCVVNRGCPAGLAMGNDGNCTASPACPAGTTFSSTHGLCVAQPGCPAGSRILGDRCSVASACPAGTTQTASGRCAAGAPPSCTWPMVMTSEGRCARPIGCPSGFTRDGNSDRCVGAPPATASCPAGYFLETIQGRTTCATSPAACPTIQGWGVTTMDRNNATCYMPLKCGGGMIARFDADPYGRCSR